MSTNYAPAAPAKKNLGQYYTPAKESTDGGWSKIRQLVKDGRRVAREERLRWQENREYYRGNQTVYVAPGEAQLRGTIPFSATAKTNMNSYNRLRQFVDGRVAILTKDRPPYEVEPEDLDQDSIDAARAAEKFIAARWGHEGWNIASCINELARNGDIDGVAWLSVQWDKDASESIDTLIAIDNQTGQPITSREQYEAYKNEDPAGQTLWRMERSTQPLGDVSWRVVLPGAISIDPFAIHDDEDARWICESRLRPRSEVEKYLGMPYKQAVQQSSDNMGERISDVQYEDLAIDDGTMLGGKVSERESVVCHYFFARPCNEFPQGLHMEFCDKAPGMPWVLEPWQDELPYECYVPRADPGHFLRSRGITDDLKPIQRDYNAILRDLREWLKRIARTPVALPFGSMASDSYFNEDGYFFYHPQMGEPHHSQVPAEPTAVLTNELTRIVDEMRELSGVSLASQGFGSSSSRAGYAVQMEITQTENNLAVTQENLKATIEWGVSRSLKLVEKHYTSVRTVTGVGVDDASEFAAFQGTMLRGAHRFHITGPLMTASKAARMQSIANLMPIILQSGGNILPHVGSLIDGDPTELQADIESDRKHQQRENRIILSYAANPLALKVYSDFDEQKQKFTQALNLAQQMGSPNAMADLAQRGITPPNLTQMMQTAGFPVPVVEDFNNHAAEIKAIDEFCKGDAYDKIAPICKQLLREQRQGHVQAMGQQIAAMAQQQPVGQQGSEPKAPGAPSPPKAAAPQPGAQLM